MPLQEITNSTRVAFYSMGNPTPSTRLATVPKSDLSLRNLPSTKNFLLTPTYASLVNSTEFMETIFPKELLKFSILCDWKIVPTFQLLGFREAWNEGWIWRAPLFINLNYFYSMNPPLASIHLRGKLFSPACINSGMKGAPLFIPPITSKKLCDFATRLVSWRRVHCYFMAP